MTTDEPGTTPTAGAAAPIAPVEPVAAPAAEPAEGDEPILPLSPAARRRLIVLVIGLVLALLAGGAGYAIGGASRDGTVDDLNAQVGLLGDAADAAARIASEADAHQVALRPAVGADRAAGEVVYAPASGRVIVIATGLAPEPVGYAYRLLLGASLVRRDLGVMAWAGGVWSWTGTVDGLAGAVGAGSYFAVSLVAADGSDIGAAVLSSP